MVDIVVCQLSLSMSRLPLSMSRVEVVEHNGEITTYLSNVLSSLCFLLLLIVDIVAVVGVCAG